MRLSHCLGLEPIKDVDRLERTFIAQSISLAILNGGRDRLFTLLEAMHMSCSAPGGVQGEASDKTKTVQHLSSWSELSDQRIIHLLIQIQPGLVALQQVGLKI